MAAYKLPITDGLTASRVVLTDANKKLVSLGAAGLTQNETVLETAAVSGITNLAFHVVTGDTWYGIGSTVWRGQTFTPTTTGYVSAVILPLCKTGNPGTVTVSIKATDAGLPTGDDLCVATFDGSTLTSSLEWRTIVFTTPVELTASTVYAICVQTSVATQYCRWRALIASPAYSGGEYLQYSVGSWSANSGRDFLFFVVTFQLTTTSTQLQFTNGILTGVV